MKKTLRITDTIPKLKALLKVNNFELASLIGISERSLNYYLDDNDSKKEVSEEIFNKITSFIENKGFDLFSLFDLDGEEYLFHASRIGIEGKISTQKNVGYLKDFGNGFYLSESFKVAATYIDQEKNPHIYRFFKKDIVKGKKFIFGNTLKDSINWVLFIGLSRGKMRNISDISFLNEYFLSLFGTSDLIIGKIADSFNFDVMDDFLKGDHDLIQVDKALKLVDIGNQYVLKNEEIANKLSYIDDFVLDKHLKDYIRKWHTKENSKLKEKNKEFLNNTISDSNLKFMNIIEKLKEENE